MMTSRRQNLFIGSAVALLFGVLCWISFDFMHSVQQSLWDNSVKNIMESTARGANVLQRGYIKDLESCVCWRTNLSRENPPILGVSAVS